MQVRIPSGKVSRCEWLRVLLLTTLAQGALAMLERPGNYVAGPRNLRKAVAMLSMLARPRNWLEAMKAIRSFSFRFRAPQEVLSRPLMAVDLAMGS